MGNGKHEKSRIRVWPSLAPYRKSLYPLGMALLGIPAALLPFTDGGTTITNAEWSAVGAAITAAGVAWLAPKNAPKKRKGETGRVAYERAKGNRNEAGEVRLIITHSTIPVWRG